MNQAKMLLANLDDLTMVSESYDSSDERIVIDDNRFITVPESLRRLGVQHDHNIETVTIDSPRYWDGHDMSKMKIYINYMCADGVVGKHLTANLQVTEDRMTFDWTISDHVTHTKGKISFLVCIVTTDADGLEERHWNSELNQECFISEGLECEEIALVQYPDIITQLLLRMDDVESIANAETIAAAIESALLKAKESGEFDGPRGPQGDKGDTGPQGPQGPQGEKGETASADFAVNDPAESGYIKNRTHWQERIDTLAEWNGDTHGRRTYTPSAISDTYYKISDICPTDEDIIGAVITMSNGTTNTVSRKEFTGFTDGVARISTIMFAISAPRVDPGNVIDYGVIGLYAKISSTGVYPAKFSNSRIVVHTLDEKFIPESIARKDDLTNGVTPLIVTVANGKPSHSAAEIAAHVQSGGTAVLKTGEDLYNFVSYSEDVNGAYFLQVDPMDLEYFQVATVYGNYVSVYTMPLALDSEVVKTVNGVKPDENGDVTVEGGGSAGLVVTVTDNTASHSDAEIEAHVKAGGTVVLQRGEDLYNFVNYSNDAGAACFVEVDAMEGDYFQTATVSGHRVTFYKMPFATEQWVRDNYLESTALPTAINTALAQAKASGEFAGADGVSATHSWNGTTLTVTSASGTSSADLKGDTGPQGPQGPKGDKGADGTGVTILGSFATEEALKAAHPTGSVGDSYLVNGNLYVWSATDNVWNNVGSIQGPKGDKGDTGPTGPQGPAGADGKDGISATHTWDGTILTITSASGTSSVNLKGDTGATGATGSSGKDGNGIKSIRIEEVT